MNLPRMHEILTACTLPLRKGEEVEQKGRVVHVWMMPHVSEVSNPDVTIVDLELLAVGVKKSAAETHRREVLELLDTYPEPERLAGGPSYIELGAELGSQEAAMQLIALGQVLGIWHVCPADRKVPHEPKAKTEAKPKQAKRKAKAPKRRATRAR